MRMKQTLRFFLLFVFTSLLLAAAFDAVAQKKDDKITVRGTVKDTSGEPLIGVSVFVEGTHIGVNTNLKGELENPV